MLPRMARRHQSQDLSPCEHIWKKCEKGKKNSQTSQDAILKVENRERMCFNYNSKEVAMTINRWKAECELGLKQTFCQRL